jgi:hypothetical protein
MPIPGSRLIPDGWEDHHWPVADAGMTATCDITRPHPGTYDPATRRSEPPTAADVWSGRCRIQALPIHPHDVDFGEHPQIVRRYQVSIPLTAAMVHANDLVHITSATDGQLAGLWMRVLDTAQGSLVWQRDLICEWTEP